MKKIGILFAGQGSQTPGMGKSLYDHCPESRAVFDAAGARIRALCFEGTAEDLAKTENTQPCVYTTSMSVWAAVDAFFRESGLTVSAMAGFSLGECAALTAAGVFSLETGLDMVEKRAGWMAKEASGKGGMCAVIGDLTKVEALCREAATSGMVIPVNYNCPGQTVVSADPAGMEAFLALCRENRMRAIPLKVGGPFHSPILALAGEKMVEYLQRLTLGAMRCPVYGNVDGLPHAPETLIDRLSRQIMSPVRWETTIRNMIADGIDFFVEIGPGKTLTGLGKKIDPQVTTIPVDSLETLENLKEKIKGEK